MLFRGRDWATRELARRVALVLLLAVCASAALAIGRSARLAPADFAFVNDAEVSSLDPAAAVGIAEGRVSRFLFEGLCAHDPNSLAVIPAAAESWNVSSDGCAYVFHMRTRARWSNGERVSARDFAWSFERLLDPRTAAEYAYALWPVKGARRFTTDVDDAGRPVHAFDTVAIHARGDEELAIELEAPLPYFLDVLAMPALAPVCKKSLDDAHARFPDAWSSEWTKPEHLVVNGPYTLAFRRVNDRIRFAKNPFYWDADHVAFETVDALAVEHVGTMLNLYLTGEVGWTSSVPASLVPHFFEREDFHAAPYLATSFYRINVTRPPLDDVRVRRALALAIDRDALVEKVAKAGERPAWSFVPPCTRGTDPVEIAHCTDRATRAACRAADEDEARRLLADAGYGPGGKPLPSIAIHYNTQSNNRDVAEVIADAWRRVLGADVRFENQEWKVYLDAQKRLEYQVSRSSWIGDHPDPIGFLEIFESASENNRTGWSSARYDELVARTRKCSGDERAALLADAETLLLDEMPIVPLYFFVTKNLVDPRLGGFYANALDEHAPKFWYWMDDEELAERREHELRAVVGDARANAIEHEDRASGHAGRASDRGDRPIERGAASVESHGPRAGLYAPAHPKYRPRERS
jgi:oligopeptide transport system substrate-binding protein